MLLHLTEAALRYAPRRLITSTLGERLRAQVRLTDIAGSAGRIANRLPFVVDGDWDQRAMPLSASNAWRVMQSIHESRGEWRQSEALPRMLERVCRGYRGGRDYPMQSEHDVIRYFETRAELWRRCREEGILADWSSPIRFAIGRDGRYLKLRDGTHRLACAYLLDLEQVPGIIWQIHPDALHRFARDLLERPPD